MRSREKPRFTRFSGRLPTYRPPVPQHPTLPHEMRSMKARMDRRKFELQREDLARLENLHHVRLIERTSPAFSHATPHDTHSRHNRHFDQNSQQSPHAQNSSPARKHTDDSSKSPTHTTKHGKNVQSSNQQRQFSAFSFLHNTAPQFITPITAHLSFTANHKFPSYRSAYNIPTFNQSPNRNFATNTDVSNTPTSSRQMDPNNTGRGDRTSNTKTRSSTAKTNPSSTSTSTSMQSQSSHAPPKVASKDTSKDSNEEHIYRAPSLKGASDSHSIHTSLTDSSADLTSTPHGKNNKDLTENTRSQHTPALNPNPTTSSAFTLTSAQSRQDGQRVKSEQTNASNHDHPMNGQNSPTHAETSRRDEDIYQHELPAHRLRAPELSIDAYHLAYNHFHNEASVKDTNMHKNAATASNPSKSSLNQSQMGLLSQGGDKQRGNKRNSRSFSTRSQRLSPTHVQHHNAHIKPQLRKSSHTNETDRIETKATSNDSKEPRSAPKHARDATPSHYHKRHKPIHKPKWKYDPTDLNSDFIRPTLVSMTNDSTSTARNILPTPENTQAMQSTVGASTATTGASGSALTGGLPTGGRSINTKDPALRTTPTRTYSSSSSHSVHSNSSTNAKNKGIVINSSRTFSTARPRHGYTKNHSKTHQNSNLRHQVFKVMQKNPKLRLKLRKAQHRYFSSIPPRSSPEHAPSKFKMALQRLFGTTMTPSTRDNNNTNHSSISDHNVNTAPIPHSQRASIYTGAHSVPSKDHTDILNSVDHNERLAWTFPLSNPSTTSTTSSHNTPRKSTKKAKTYSKTTSRRTATEPFFALPSPIMDPSSVLESFQSHDTSFGQFGPKGSNVIKIVNNSKTDQLNRDIVSTPSDQSNQSSRAYIYHPRSLSQVLYNSKSNTSKGSTFEVTNPKVADLATYFASHVQHPGYAPGFDDNEDDMRGIGYDNTEQDKSQGDPFHRSKLARSRRGLPKNNDNTDLAQFSGSNPAMLNSAHRSTTNAHSNDADFRNTVVHTLKDQMLARNSLHPISNSHQPNTNRLHGSVDAQGHHNRSASTPSTSAPSRREREAFSVIYYAHVSSQHHHISPDITDNLNVPHFNPLPQSSQLLSTRGIDEEGRNMSVLNSSTENKFFTSPAFTYLTPKNIHPFENSSLSSVFAPDKYTGDIKHNFVNKRSKTNLFTSAMSKRARENQRQLDRENGNGFNPMPTHQDRESRTDVVFH